MDPADKPRADSKLKTLPEDRQCEIAEYGREHTIVDTVEWLRANGIESNSASMSEFLAWYRLRQQMERNDLAIVQILEEVAARNPDLTPERIYELGQVFFSGFALAKQDPNAWCITQRTALSRARLELALQKYRDAKQAADGTAAPGGLTPETIRKIENELHLR